MRVLLRILLIVMIPPGAARASELVRVVDAAEMDWPEGRRSIEVELRASGYQLEEAQSDAVEPGLLLEQLQQKSATAVAASVTVVRMGRSGIAYVWLPETARLYRVTSSESDEARAANVLSLRVVELISLRGSGFEVDESPPPQKASTTPAGAPPTLQHPPQERAPKWAALIGAGLGFGSGLSRPLANLYLGMQRNVIPALALELSGEFSLTSAAQTFEPGKIEVAQQAFRLGALVQTKLVGRLEGQIGPTFGLRCFDFRIHPTARPEEAKQRTCGPMAGALARLGLRWSAFSVWLAGVGEAQLAPIRLTDDGEDIATLGRPSASLLGGIGWAF